MAHTLSMFYIRLLVARHCLIFQDIQTFNMSNEGTVGLNNYLQAANMTTTLAWAESRSGPAHAPEWTVICKINGVEMGRGTGPNKHVARDAAANQALNALRDTDDSSHDDA